MNLAFSFSLAALFLSFSLGFSVVELTKTKNRINQLKTVNSSVTMYPESRYDSSYLHNYKQMIGSLLGPIGGTSPANLIKPEMRLGSDHSTASNLYGNFKNSIPECSKIGLTGLKLIKVIQDEESNYVMLKENQVDGKLYVEKSTKRRESFTNELEFFLHLDRSNRYFPKMVCHMPTPGREHRFSVMTEFIRGRDSHLAAGLANSSQLKSMVQQLFDAVVDLHRMGYIHADIKPGNVLVTDNFEVKLIDFGMASRVGKARKFRGSPYTRAPELHELCPGPVDIAIDWWAFGSTVSIWYYYHHANFNKHFSKKMAKKDEMMNPDIAQIYFEVFSSYEFTPFKWTGNKFNPGFFPSSFEADVRRFLALFLVIDPELRTFDSVRLQTIARDYLSNV
jgi:serine/threonine protein kinase